MSEQESVLNRVSKQPQGSRRFSFVVVADTHVNETDHSTRSPFASNVMANNRARHVFAEIAAMTPPPDFVVHLGDAVHPVPGVPSFEDAAARFKELASLVPMPLYLVPGNHDIGEKNLDGVPADIVCDEYIAKYNRIFGRDYFSFEHRDIKAFILNAFLFNSGLASEQTQKEWLDREIANTDKRVFVFIHCPPYLYEPGEREIYDTIDEPGRSWLLERLRSEKVEAVFAGHVHNFWYDVVGRAEMYMLPSTAFLRHDYTEFYRIHPGDEHGRSDNEKLGYCVVQVHERGHVAHLIRTHGQNLAENQALPIRKLAPCVHPKTSTLSNFGVELRHAWSEVVQIPCTGGIEEFGRKLARNDYQLMALWETGIRTLKVPEQDLRDPGTIARAQLMSDVGHDFIVTMFGVPDHTFMEQMLASQVRVSALELNLTMQEFRQRAGEIAQLRKTASAKIIFCKLRTTEESHFDGKHFSHFVNAGVRIEEMPGIRTELASLILDGIIDGITVRLDRGTDIVAAASQLNRFADQMQCEMVVSVKLSDESLAGLIDDDFDTARLAAEAIIASKSSERVRYVFDTFMDIDRGYFPRNGFIDRRFNPRPASSVVASLVAALPQTGGLNIRSVTRDQGHSVVNLTVAEKRYSLVSGATKEVARHLRTGDCTGGVNLLTKETFRHSLGDELQAAQLAGERALIFVAHD